MKSIAFRAFLVLLLGLLIGLPSWAAPMTEQQKIEAMIHGIEVLPGAKFIRNGSSYDGKAAADHLRMKLRNAGSRVRTAEQFITAVASGSSMSGQPYQIVLADGRKITSEAYFRAELKQIESPPAASSTAPNAPASPPKASSAAH